MTNKEKTWEERISHARAVNAAKQSAGVNNAPAVKTVSASSGQTKSWDDRIAHAKSVNAAKAQERYQKLISSNEYKWAAENEKRLKTGLGYSVNNGQIYSFEPITRDSLQKSIEWADSEIKKLKEQGGSSSPIWDFLANLGNTGNDVRATTQGKKISDSSQQIRELEGQIAVYKKYLENAEYEEAISEIKKNGDGERFSELFAIDSRKNTLLDALGNIGSGGNAMPSRNVGDIEREAQLKAELLAKYGENFNKYRELYAKGTNDEFKASLVEKMEETIEEHPVLGTIGYTLGNVFSSPVRGIGAVSDALSGASGNYGASSGGIFQDMSEATVQKVNNNINKTFQNKYAAGLVRSLYNAAVSGAESMLSMGTFGKFGEAVLGLNAATSTYKSAKERGFSDGQALMNGIAAGIFESLFEHVSLEKLRVFQASPSTSLKPFIKNVLKQSLTEGSEEMFTDIANEAYDYLVNGGLSQYEQALQSGMTAEEYAAQFGLQLIETFATGALSGGGMVGVVTAPTAVKGTVSDIISDKKQGSYIRQYGSVEATLQKAKEQGGNLGRKATKLEKTIKDGENISERDIGRIDRISTVKEREKVVDTILASEEYKGLEGKEKRAIRSSVLTYLKPGGIVAPEQAEVLETENGKKVLEATRKWEVDKVMEEMTSKQTTKSENIRKAVDEKNTESLVKNTFEAENADGHKITVGAVRSIIDGEFEVVQDEETGATAKLSEIKIKDRQARELYSNLELLATGENPLSIEAVNVALSMYNTLDNTSARAYALWVHDAYKAGSLKINDTVLTFAEFEEMFKNKYKTDISRTQLREIYEIGAKNLEIKPGITRIGHKGLSKFQAEQVFILSERAKKLGLQLVLTDGKLTDTDGRGVNALYVEGTNRIVLSLQSDLNLILVHAGHEIFHWAKNQNKEMLQFLQNSIINTLKSDSRYDYDGIYKQVSAEYEGLSEEDILEEIAAQYMGVAFADESSIRKTVATATTEQKSFLKKMVEYLKDFIKSLKDLINIYGDRDKTVRAAVKTPVDQLEYFAETFERILEETAAKKKPATEEGGVKASLSKEDIAAVQSFAKRTSVNDFTSDEIEKTKALAEIFYKDIKEKSPFFRAWFGDWREYDTTPVTIANKKGSNKVPINNKDTGWDIQVSRKVFNETKSHKGKINISALSYLEYINDIVQNAVLLDSFTMDKDKSENSLFMHSFYAVADIGNGPELLKLYVEEMNNPNAENTSKRAYQLQNIEKQQVAVTGSQMNSVSRISQPTVINTVSDLFKDVKNKDKNFKPNPVNPAFLNEDGTPKVYYHGTNATWTEYDLSKNVNQMWGEGIYLTPDYDRAKLYGDNVMPFYVRALVDNRTAKKTGQKKDHTIMKNGDVLVYSPEQIKSATDNIGTFDRTKKDIRYSVKRDIDGNRFVDVDPTLFDARDGESHAKTIARIIKDRFNNLISVNGQQIQINKTTNDEWRRSKSANGFIKKDPQLYVDKLKTISHTDEILQAAKNWIGEEPSHKRDDDIVEFARGNVYYRVGNNGYVADVIVAIRKNGAAVLYDLRNIYEKKITEASVTMASQSPQRSAETSVTDNISQLETDVNKKYSRQRLNDTWEGIRDKMYENEVHEDIIGEIETYIKKLTTRKLARETAITEGLIPKYEAILKVAREYTKGSEVSAHQLADTINELMWAAHDGNLDTKQFISTVKLIAEDIIRTGSQINDDMYREYEEFRKMTREETVYVSQQVYDHYVEEYSTRKNLNRACAGKIKIKPYDDGNRTGRSLDDFYAELQERFPEMFKEDVDVYHQLFRILDVWQAIQPWTEYRTDMLGIKSRADLEQQSLIITEEILSEVLGIKDTVKTIADKYSDKLKYQQEHYKEYYRKQAEEGRRRRRERESIAVLNKRILRNTNRLSDMIRNETDQRHIPDSLKQPVMDFLNMITLTNESGREVLWSNGTLNMVKLGNAYKEYFNPKEGKKTIPKSQYDEDVIEWIEELALTFGEAVNIKNISFEELQKVDNIVLHLSHIVKHENEIFVNGRREIFSKWANESTRQMYRHAHKPEYETQTKILKAEYGMLTPIYFFKAIGTTTEKGGYVQEERLFSMFRDLQEGQDKWYRNIERTRNDLAEIKKKYHYSDSWKRDTREFTLTSGEKIKLTAEEIMYMRALYIREGKHINNLNHLLEGGIVIENDGKLKGFAEKMAAMKEIHEARKKFKKNKESEKTYTRDDISERLKKNLTAEDLKVIFAALTEDMEGYSEAIVNMLSTTGADLGNKVSMELFGIKKFTEKNYIPISVVSDFIATTIEKRNADTAKLKNRSFTKRTTRNANAAVYVRSITDIAAEHMQEMCLYNAMTVPIENITRVFNYQLPDNEFFDDEGKRIRETGNSFKEIFEAVYGIRGKKYFENFLRDMNGGNQTPARDFTSRMLGTFKKSAVMGSFSVAIQQPSAVVRACALVDAKYFVGKPYNSADYAEMLKYCPVAGIKEIGRFDTGLGSTATEWILNDKNGFFDMAENVLSFLPGMMDRMTWVHIWNAVKRETRANNKDLTGEALLERAAERFRDVIDYTQVYDSTLSRSEFMRDQGTVAKMATSFMAEPTLTYNLLRDAVRNAGNDKKQAVKSVAAFVGATLLNAFLKSFVTALRKDDEETNYFEVYVSDFISNFFGDLNPLGMIPVVKDVMSIVAGYDVKRLDMSLFESLVNSAKVITNKLSKGKIPTFEECFTLVGTATAFTGVPLNNVFRDFMAAISTLQGIGKSPDFSLREALTSEKTSDAVKLYRAIIAGDEDAVNRYKKADTESVKEYISQGYSETDAILKATDNAENNFHTKVIDGLISKDIRIKEAAEARLTSDVKIYEELLEELTELGFDRNDVVQAVDKYIKSLEEKTYKQNETKDKAIYNYDDLFSAINTDKMTSAKHIFDKLSENVSKETVQENIRDEYAEAIYEAILNNNKTEKQRLEKIFEEFNYDYHYAVILGLRENDERISEAAEARYKGDIQEYESIKAELLSDGFDENDIFNAIETETEKLAPDEEKEESHPESSYLYEPADLKRYADSFNLSATKRAIQNFRDSGKDDGDIRKTLTGVFKKKYIEAWKNGNDVLVVKIRDFLDDCDVGYSSKQFSNWEKEANGNS